MIQPNWKLVAQLGDVHPIEYGGYFVYEDTTGQYDPEAELLIAPDDDDGQWTAYRFTLEPCTFIDGVLSDNKFHPEHPAWFAGTEAQRLERPQDSTYLKNIADFAGVSVEELVSYFTGNIEARASAWRLVGEYHGFENLDGYPLTMNKAEAEARYAEELATA